jgi:hypothetical protein
VFESQFLSKETAKKIKMEQQVLMAKNELHILKWFLLASLARK